MEVKKYIGADTQDALAKLKKDLGSEAVILNTRTIRQKGFLGFFKKPAVEIIAAKDNSHKKINKIKKEESISGINNELKALRNLVEDMAFKSNNTGQDFNVNLEKYRKILVSNGVNYKIATSILKTIDEQINIKEKTEEEVKKVIKFNLKESIGRIEPIDIESIPKIIFLIGPTGVGKTTTLAKIAARLIIDKNYDVGLVTTDTYRIAAVEQLKTYSEILELPVKVVYQSDEMYKAVVEFKNKDIILVDTAGRSHKDEFQMKETKKLIDSVNNKEVFLVLSATTDFITLKSIINQYKFIDDYKIIFTKLDEANGYGNILNAKFCTDNPLSYFTTGQDVPDDIEKVNVRKVVEHLIEGN
ncbi:MAG: flagellar biosynthesis protein FlhF [Clostridiaceae bacterium]|nr:flagellar biosynthesis protein FlhF [Clostridiaceae bacterium]MBW4858754.1 flagellar biosynthesis protein FlhF [Clostridiaceae bacterium]MBW4868213.1 flagellar biosynthesis protein FlhF [Clostridiaceae bacterium]